MIRIANMLRKDVGLNELKELEHLTYLALSGTNTTDAGVKKLKESLPNLSMSRP